jgi:hypothetical protein
MSIKQHFRHYTSMKNDPKEKKKTLINVAIAAVSIIIVAAIFIIRFTPWVWYDHSEKPLGIIMEYIGKHDYGCAPGPCIGGEPGTTYYYATDMSMEEVEGYFKGANVKKIENFSGQSSAGYFYTYLSFELKSNGSRKTIINYYNDGAAVIKTMSLRKSLKKYAISLDAVDYVLIKAGL